MMTLDEARQKQAKLQKQTVIKFLIYIFLIIVAFVVLFVFTDYLEKYSVLYTVFLVLLYFAFKNSKFYCFFTPKEFTGVIKYLNVTVENVKKYASHQPGSTYSTNEVQMLYFVVEHNNKTVRKKIEYDWHWGEFYEGQTITILRFIERPFLVAEPVN